MKWWRLYRFFSEDGELLYVGISRDPHERFVEHLRSQPWAREVGRWELDRRVFVDELEARAMERLAIMRGRPCYNVVHNGDPQRSRTEYKQLSPLLARRAAPAAVNGKPVASGVILDVLQAAHPRSLTSKQVGAELSKRGAGLSRTYRQDVLKLLRTTGQAVQDSYGAYRAVTGCLVSSSEPQKEALSSSLTEGWGSQTAACLADTPDADTNLSGSTWDERMMARHLNG
jgi:hypothetical protein